MIERGKWKDAGKTAVALAYEPGDVAPKILATGTGAVADRIIEKAKESNVPLYKDNKLADTLSRLKIGDAPRKASQGLPARVFRRHAPARDDCHGAHHPPADTHSR